MMRSCFAELVPAPPSWSRLTTTHGHLRTRTEICRQTGSAASRVYPTDGATYWLFATATNASIRAISLRSCARFAVSVSSRRCQPITSVRAARISPPISTFSAPSIFDLIEEAFDRNSSLLELRAGALKGFLGFVPCGPSVVEQTLDHLELIRAQHEVGRVECLDGADRCLARHFRVAQQLDLCSQVDHVGLFRCNRIHRPKRDEVRLRARSFSMRTSHSPLVSLDKLREPFGSPGTTSQVAREPVRCRVCLRIAPGRYGRCAT